MANQPVDVEFKGIWFWKKLKAKPSPRPASLNDSIVWQVRENFENATLSFPNSEEIFGAGTPDFQDFPKSGLISRPVLGKPKLKTPYRYTVFAKIDGEQWQAEGNSPPEVIIQ